MRAIELLEYTASKSCIVVDVQPTYEETGYGESNFGIFRNIARFLMNQTGPILMFVNAEQEGFTEDSISSIQDYWDKNLGIKHDESFWNRVTIDDKGYGYFRAWMDEKVPESAIIKTIRLMYQNRVSDSRLLFGGENSDDYAINMMALGIPEEILDDGLGVEWTSVAQLKRFSGSYIMGGGRNECLREVELLMNAFNIKYREIEEFIYG